MCRLAVQHGPNTVELALPSDAPVGVLLPSVVDLVGPDGAAIEEGLQWHLSRIGQGPLDESMSLRDNAVRDGELLLLATAAIPAPIRVPDDRWQALIETCGRQSAPKPLTAAAGLCTAMLGATALAWSGVVTPAAGHVVTAGATAAGAAIAAVVARRARQESTIVGALSVIAVVFGAVAGFLAVPAGPSTANALLAAAVACSISIMLFRVTCCAAICLTALATSGALTSAAAAVGVAWTFPIASAGAVLATLSLGALGMAARLSITASGLAPPMPTSEPREDDAFTLMTPRAITAHESFTGLVIGSAAAAALGAMLVASDMPDSRPAAVLFAVAVGLVMVLRARTHIDVYRRAALVTAGMAAVAASCIDIVVSAPGQANWMCLAAAAAGVSMLGRGFGAAGNPLARRAIDVLEYVALASVLPLACWVGGLYGLVRGLSMP